MRKTTQAQSPAILMTLQMTLRHTSKSHLKPDVCTGGRNPTSKLGMRKSMGGDFFQGVGGGGISLNIIIMWGQERMIYSLSVRGNWYFIHFPAPTPRPPPGNYCTVPKISELALNSVRPSLLFTIATRQRTDAPALDQCSKHRWSYFTCLFPESRDFFFFFLIYFCLTDIY